MSDNNVNPNVNPANEALPTVVEYCTQSGVLIHVTPLSLFLIQAVINKSEDIFEYPSEKDYRLTEQLNESGEMVQADDVIASGFFPASENPEYVALCKAVDTERLDWQGYAFIELACTFPQYESRDAMIAFFRPQLEKMRRFAAIPEDEWKAILDFCVFTKRVKFNLDKGGVITTTERNTVILLAQQNINQMLTTSEVVGAMRVFRLQLPK